MNLVTDQLKRLPIRKPPMTPKQAKKKSALTEWMKNDPADDIKI
jgi:PIN domain nuclease of toxin-antitoxin system